MERPQRWAVPRFATHAVAVALGGALIALVKGDSVGPSAVGFVASFVALVLLVAWDALGRFR
jgi:hypothetical protein